VPEAGVKIGDRGVVLLVFGEPGPCVVYSPDLSEVYSHHPGY